MRVRNIIAVVALSLTGACVSAPRSESQLPLLVMADGLPPPQIDEWLFRGTSVEGSAIRVEIKRETGNTLVLGAWVDDVSWGTARLRPGSYPALDFGTLQLGMEDRRAVLQVSFNYGQTRACFMDYDGRDRVMVVFSAAEVTVYETSFENCHPTTRTIVQPPAA